MKLILFEYKRLHFSYFFFINFIIFIVNPCMSLQFVVNVIVHYAYFSYYFNNSLLEFNELFASFYLMYTLQIQQLLG